jgi:hypothetical protein
MPARRTILVLTALVTVVFPTIPARSAAGPSERSVPTPQLIERAVARGEIGSDRAALYLAYALRAPEKLPAAYRSDVPWQGTLPALRLQEALEGMADGAVRTEIETLLFPEGASADPGPGGIGTDTCFISVSPMPNTLLTEHFYIEYDALRVNFGPDGLTIEDYAESLETSWETEVDAFGWATPPALPANPPPDGRYHVRIDELTPVIYGFVSNGGTHAGDVGDNPHTSWEEPDAQASCMVLNYDYSLFPGTPQRALDATTAHEFNHSIQFGLGTITGSNEPDSVFIEGGATWMEDEVFDGSNDNYNYLWPRFNNDMGEYEDSPYPYWITWRGMTERYGASVPQGGEDVMQLFWELVSREEALGMDALNLALRAYGTTLPEAYHAYAIAVKFNRPCTGGYSYPYCFEEGPQYVNGDGVQQGAGETQPHGRIETVGGSHSGQIPDNYALNWVVLPISASRYRATLANTSAGGAFRLSVVCDTGSGFDMRHTRLIGPARSATLPVTSTGCQSIVAVITNLAQTGADPEQSVSRSYSLSTQPATRS